MKKASTMRKQERRGSKVEWISAALFLAVGFRPGLAAVPPSVPGAQPSFRADQFTDFVGINGSPLHCYVILAGPYAGAGKTFNGNLANDWSPGTGDLTGVYTLCYHAGSPGQTLTVSWTLDTEPTRFLSQARLQAATLALAGGKGRGLTRPSLSDGEDGGLPPDKPLRGDLYSLPLKCG